MILDTGLVCDCGRLLSLDLTHGLPRYVCRCGHPPLPHRTDLS